jgi:hypothetical protein
MKEIDYEPKIATAPSGPIKHWGEKAIPLRTYADDVAQAMKAENITKTRIIIAEQERRAKNAEESDETHRHLLFGILIAATLFAFLVGIVAVTFFGVGRSEPITDPTGTIPMTTTKGEAQGTERVVSRGPKLDITDMLRSQVIADLRILSKEISSKTILTTLSVEKNGRAAELHEVFAVLLGTVPTRIAGEDSPYTLSLVRSSSTVAVLAIRVSSYGEALNAMLGSEMEIAIGMNGILDPFETADIRTVSPMGKFRNISIGGVDARILRREDGTARFIWGIVDRSILVLAPDEYAFTSVVSAIKNGELLH